LLGLVGLILLALLIAVTIWAVFNYVLPPSSTPTPIL